MIGMLKTRDIYSPMVSGSGALIVHQQLSQAISGYRVSVFSPSDTLFPPALRRYRREAEIVHTAPDFGPFLLGDNSLNVLTFHNFYLDDFMLSQSSWAQRCFYRSVLGPCIRAAIKKADVITAVSDATASLVRPLVPRGIPFHVIKNGVDENLFTPITRNEPEKIRILFAGNPSRRKGLNLLKSVADQLGNKVEILCTQGMRNVEVPNSVKKTLKFLPRVSHDQMPSLYQQADIFLFPSFREGLSLVMLEAMACGLPIVTTNLSSMPELVVQNKGGFLCNYQSADDLVNRLSVLITSPNLREEMGNFNRERILNEFRQSRMVYQYQSLFDASRKK